MMITVELKGGPLDGEVRSVENDIDLGVTWVNEFDWNSPLDIVVPTGSGKYVLVDDELSNVAPYVMRWHNGSN